MPHHSISALFALSLVALVSASSPSLARSMCWIDHLVKAEGGIKVYFIAQDVLTISMTETATASHTVSNGLVRDQVGRETDHLYVNDGGQFFSRRTTEQNEVLQDACFYR